MPTNATCPLIVDLDGTLCATDTLWEGVMHMASTRPALCVLLPAWLWRGRLNLKLRMAPYAVAALPWIPLRQSVLSEIRAAKANGRQVWLATASPAAVAEAMRTHLATAHGAVVDGVLGSTPERNLKGEAKRQALCDAFGHKGFDYIGNDAADLPVWKEAREAIAVGCGKGVLDRLPPANGAWRALASPTASAKTFLAALRPHQWAKNILVLLPIILAHMFTLTALSNGILAFVSFCCCASAVYLLNDLLDLQADRQHHTKRYRPFAAGLLPLWSGPAAALGLLLLSGLSALVLPREFGIILAVYFASTLAYSLFLKRLVMMDVVVLSILYILRIVAGCAAIEAAVSRWFLAFSVFLFVGLALIKRINEIYAHADVHIENSRRGYVISDVNILETMSIASTFCSAVILALYIDSVHALRLYTHPDALWLLLPLMLYVYGTLFLAMHRRRMQDDIIAYVLHDRILLLSAAVGCGILLLAM